MGSNTSDTLHKSSANIMNRRGCKNEGKPEIRSTLELFMGAACTNFFLYERKFENELILLISMLYKLFS